MIFVFILPGIILTKNRLYLIYKQIVCQKEMSCSPAVVQSCGQLKDCMTARPVDCKTLFINLGPGILKRYCPVENQMFFRGIIVNAKITKPLELEFIKRLYIG
jgi:hypothetical protein